jgi:type IV pilus assembly protein PilW
MSAPEGLLRHKPCRVYVGRLPRGVSMLELMVGIVISLLVGLAAATGAATFLAAQRQSVGVGGALINVETVLASVREEATAAGLGFFADGAFLCPLMNLSNGTAVIMDGSPFIPVWVTPDGSNSRLDILSANTVTGGATVRLGDTSLANSAEVTSLIPAAVGEAILLAPLDPSEPCVVRTVTANTVATATAPQALSYASITSARHNRAAFTTSPLFLERSRMALLGQLRWTRFRLSGTNLIMERPLEGTSATLAHNVTAFRVEYGMAATGASALSAWSPANAASAPVAASNLARLRALRIGIVTRSPQREKPLAGGACAASTGLPPLFGTATTADVSDWQCFRFRTAQTIVPLRNLLLGLTP